MCFSWSLIIAPFIAFSFSGLQKYRDQAPMILKLLRDVQPLTLYKNPCPVLCSAIHVKIVLGCLTYPAQQKWSFRGQVGIKKNLSAQGLWYRQVPSFQLSRGRTRELRRRLLLALVSLWPNAVALFSLVLVVSSQIHG
jgi:hypothetical protein